LVGDHIRAVEQSADGYRDGLAALFEDHAERVRLGRRAAEVARCRWDPAAMETKVVDIYRRLVATRRTTKP
jgi:hypothetical protein